MEQNGRAARDSLRRRTRSTRVITDGQIQRDILELIGKDEAWLTESLAKMGHRDLSRLFLVEYREGKLLVSGF